MCNVYHYSNIHNICVAASVYILHCLALFMINLLLWKLCYFGFHWLTYPLVFGLYSIHTFYYSGMPFVLCVLNVLLHCLVSIALPYFNNLGDFRMFVLLLWSISFCILFIKIKILIGCKQIVILLILYTPSSTSRSASSVFCCLSPYFKSGLTQRPRRVRCR